MAAGWGGRVGGSARSTAGVRSLDGPFDETEDLSGHLQDLIDTLDGGGAGIARIQVSGGGTLLIDQSVFLDSTTTHRQFLLDFDGRTTLRLGSNLAQASTFAYAEGIGWAFHVNTLRSALADGVVTHSDATRATGSGFPPSPRLTIRNAVINAADTASGLVYANTAAVRLEQCTFRHVRFGLSWRGYSDAPAVIGGQHSPAGITDAWIVVQEDFGDGVVIQGFKGEESGVWWSRWCNGGKVLGCINGGYYFRQCHGIEIDAHHWEANRATWEDRPMVDIDRSVVTLNSPVAYAGTSGARHIVRIDDTAGEDGSLVVINRPHFLKYLASEDTDVGRVADVHIAAANNSTRLRITSPSGALSVQPGGDSARHNRDGLLVTSDEADITAALEAAHGMCWPDAELRFRNSSWEVIQPGPLGGVRAVRALNAPTFSSVATSSTALGTLTESTTYEYVAAMRDADGNYSAQSTVRSAVAPASGTLLALITCTTAPGDLVIWRKAGTGVQTTPDAYVVIPFDGYTGRFYDTGVHINGRVWLTEDVPVPDTVAASNGTWNRLVLPSGQWIGSGSGSPENTYAAPAGSLYLRTNGIWYEKITGTGSTGWVAQGHMKSLTTQTGASYTLALTDAGKVVLVNRATAASVTVPPNSEVAFQVGTIIEIVQQGAGQVTIAPGTGVTIDNPFTSLDLRAQNSSARLLKRATDTWVVLNGDMAPA